MNENRISISLSPDDINEITESINTLSAKLQPLLIALEANDKKSLAKIGEKSVSFVEKTVQYSQNNPEFLPPFINPAELKKDYEAYTVLNSFLRPLSQIVKNLDDTATLCGSEAILACFAYYNSVKQGVKMGVPNASTVYGDLSQRFEAQKARKIKVEELK